MASKALAGALFWTVPCLFWGTQALCCSHCICISNRTTPGTHEHAVGSENGERGLPSSHEVILKLVWIGWGSSQQVQSLNMKLTISGQPKIVNVFHLLRPISSLSITQSSSSSHIHMHFIKIYMRTPSIVVIPTGGVREDRWRQIVWGKRKDGTKEANGNEAELKTEGDDTAGESATRLKPHLFSASLPIWTINQQREQGKINTNSTAESRQTVALHHSLTKAHSFRHSPSNSVLSVLASSCHSIYPWFFPFPTPGPFLFSSCLPYSSLSLWLMLASNFWVIYIFFESLHLNLKIKTQWRSSGRHTANAGDERDARYLRSHLRNLNWNTTDSVLGKHRHVATLQNVH